MRKDLHPVTPSLGRKVRELHEYGLTAVLIGKRLGICAATVHRLIYEKRKP